MQFFVLKSKYIHLEVKKMSLGSANLRRKCNSVWCESLWIWC